jgi:hypothetical protein
MYNAIIFAAMTINPPCGEPRRRLGIRKDPGGHI